MPRGISQSALTFALAVLLVTVGSIVPSQTCTDEGRVQDLTLLQQQHRVHRDAATAAMQHTDNRFSSHAQHARHHLEHAASARPALSSKSMETPDEQHQG